MSEGHCRRPFNFSQFLHTDYLKLSDKGDMPHFKIPENRTQKIDAVYLSPPWGGPDYYYLKEYTLDHINPNFDKIMKKSLEFSSNLILFIPKNTSVENLITRLLPYHKAICGDKNELVIEI